MSSQRLPRFEPPTIPDNVTSKGSRCQTKRQYSALNPSFCMSRAVSGRSEGTNVPFASVCIPTCASWLPPRALALNSKPLRVHGGAPFPAAFKPPPQLGKQQGHWPRGNVNMQPKRNNSSPPNGRAMPRPASLGVHMAGEPGPSEYCPFKVRPILFRTRSF